MFDPSALGTFIIGLEGDDRERLWLARGAPARPRSRRLAGTARLQLAAGLRRLAAALEPMRLPVPETSR